MKMIDCFIVGHHEIDMMRQRQILRLSYGENTHFYRETNMSNLGYLKYQGRLYSTSQLFNLFNRENEIVDASYEDMGLSETFSLAIAYLGSHLDKMGFTFDYINSFSPSNREKLKAALCENRVRTVAITTTYYVFASPLLEVVNFVKKTNSNVKIIIGGPYIANRVRSLAAQELQTTLKSFGADVYINSTEGEKTLTSVVNAVKNQLPFEAIPNIYYKDRDHYEFTFLEPENNALDQNIVNWSLFTDGVKRFVNVRTSISCPYACSFCNYPVYAGKYRQSSLATLEKELDVINSLGKVSGIWLIDDTLNSPPQRFKEILRMMIHKHYSFKWHSFLRCQYLDRETVELMKASGCEHVLLGIESGSQQILNNMNKAATVDKYLNGIALLNEYQIVSTASIIIGFPGETADTYQGTVDFIEEAQPTFFRSHMWWYDHSAPIHQQKERYQLQGSGLDWSHSTMDSDTARELNDRLFLTIQNSIYETECPIPFHLLNRGISLAKIKKYLNAFNDCIKQKLLTGHEEISPERFELIRSTFLN